MLEKIKYFDPEDNELEDRIILVSGAGSGIGKEASIQFSDYGAKLILLSKNLSHLEEVHNEIINRGNHEPLIHQIDFNSASEKEYKDISTAIENQYEKLDCLLNNAAILGEKKPIEHYDSLTWDVVIQTNLRSPFLLTKNLIPLLRKSDSGSILFSSSGVGKKGRAYWGAYSVSKFAIEGLNQILAEELDNTSNIRVNCINPGATRTQMRQKAYPAENPNEVEKPEKKINSYIYFMSKKSKSINGVSIDLI
tara:strand:- start:85207 stop:85959 length:753 start_codon:yes stop_codon:yes gene_type:complete